MTIYDLVEFCRKNKCSVTFTCDGVIYVEKGMKCAQLKIMDDKTVFSEENRYSLKPVVAISTALREAVNQIDAALKEKEAQNDEQT